MGKVVQQAPAPSANIAQVKEYHPPLGGRDGLRLDFNENTVACSPRISAGDLTRYPERAPVEARVAELLGVEPAQVLLTNGVDEAIHILCQTYLDETAEMLLPVPTYTMYEIYASATRARIVTVASTEGFHFPADRLLSAITDKTRVIAIANPNSPTGSIAPRGEIVRILDAAPQAIVLVDEAYFHFFGETVLDLLDRYPNLVVSRTFSKAYGLAGLRLGALVANPDVMRWLRRVISPYSVNALALACLPAALDDTDYLDWYVSEVKAAREQFHRALVEHGLPCWPSQANFVLVRVGACHREFVSAMHARGVLVRDRSADPGCEGCVRITVGTREQMAASATALRESLAAIGWEQGDLC